jgi:hypothetical protein
MADLKKASENLGWRRIVIPVKEARGKAWDELIHEYDHWQHHPDAPDIYWRKKDDAHTFIFSRKAATEAEAKGRLKGMRLELIDEPLVHEGLLAAGFSCDSSRDEIEKA